MGAQCGDTVEATTVSTMPWVALDCGIGVGKTTVLDFMRREGVPVLQEPVGDPSTQTRGPWDALLEDMYAQRPGASFAFQQRVVQDRALSDAVVETGQSLTSWACMERSPDMQRRTFVRMQSFDEAQKQEIEAAYEGGRRLMAPRGDYLFASIAGTVIRPDEASCAFFGVARRVEVSPRFI